MDSLKLCGGALCAVILCAVIKQTRAELSPLISLAACVMLFGAAIASMYPAAQYVTSLVNEGVYGGYLATLIKSLGIALTTGMCAEICRDAGENAIASKLELLGKAEILLLSLPMIRELINLTGAVLG